MALTNAEKQAAYRARKAERGLKRVDLWIPEGGTTPPELAKMLQKLLAEMDAKAVWDAVDRNLILGQLAGIAMELDTYEV